MTSSPYALAALLLGASLTAVHAAEPTMPMQPAPSSVSTNQVAPPANANLTAVDRYIIQRNIRRNR